MQVGCCEGDSLNIRPVTTQALAELYDCELGNVLTRIDTFFARIIAPTLIDFNKSSSCQEVYIRWSGARKYTHKGSSYYEH